MSSPGVYSNIAVEVALWIWRWLGNFFGRIFYFNLANRFAGVVVPIAPESNDDDESEEERPPSQGFFSRLGSLLNPFNWLSLLDPRRILSLLWPPNLFRNFKNSAFSVVFWLIELGLIHKFGDFFKLLWGKLEYAASFLIAPFIISQTTEVVDTLVNHSHIVIQTNSSATGLMIPLLSRTTPIEYASPDYFSQFRQTATNALAHAEENALYYGTAFSAFFGSLFSGVGKVASFPGLIVDGLDAFAAVLGCNPFYVYIMAALLVILAYKQLTSGWGANAEAQGGHAEAHGGKGGTANNNLTLNFGMQPSAAPMPYPMYFPPGFIPPGWQPAMTPALSQHKKKHPHGHHQHEAAAAMAHPSVSAPNPPTAHERLKRSAQSR
ncbi:MAG: hypothetical protein ACHQUC_07855 [Chlamydiales bacterium]